MVPVMYTCDDHVGVSWPDAVAAFGWLTLRREAKRLGRPLPVQSYCGVAAMPMEVKGGQLEATLFSAGLLPTGRVISGAISAGKEGQAPGLPDRTGDRQGHIDGAFE